MRKQYIVSQGHSTFQHWLTTYRDGVKIDSTKVWQGDECADFLDKLEVEGYGRAYTKEAVQKAKAEYEFLLARQLVEAE